MPEVVVFGISTGFPELSRSEGQIAHVLLTRSPLVYSRRSLTARLACVKHAASVRPEPGSNSPLNYFRRPAEARAPIFGDVPARDRITDMLSESSFFLPKEPPTSTPRGAGRCQSDGYQTNSSTFGTLLSSQGSSAHPRSASRSTRGQPGKTYRFGPGPSNRNPGCRRPLHA